MGTIILLLLISFIVLPTPIYAQGQLDAAGLPQIEYLFSRIVCTTVPLAFIAMLVMLIIAGIKYLTSAGEAKAIQAAHFTVTWGLLGILFMAIAWLILQLIQSFTGLQITTFSVSSLTNLPGLNQSCWQPAPVSFRTNSSISSAPTSTNLSATSTNTLTSNPNQKVCSTYPNSFNSPWEVRICEFKPQNCNNPVLFLKIPPQYASMRIYHSADDIIPLGNVFNRAQTIFVLTGSSDNNLYILSDRPTTQLINSTLLNQFYPDLLPMMWSTYVNNPSLPAYGKYPKNNFPTELVKAQISARQIAEKLEPNADNYYGTYIEVNKYACEDGDYYSATAHSPLIYLYPTKRKSFSVTIGAKIISPKIPLENNGSWKVIASEDGSLSNLAVPRFKFIPYEFINATFPFPNHGTVVEDKEIKQFLTTKLMTKLGLTPQEIDDYWKDIQSKLPNKKYFYISLVTRELIDKILPLKVSPLPKTIIRNMIYIKASDEPLTNYTELDLESINNVTRDGDTLLENGVYVNKY